MTAQPAGYDDDYEEYDDFDEEENEGGLSGLVVLLMGIVMLTAFASVVWIAYKQGVRTGAEASRGAPIVVAEPEPLKIENDAAPGADNVDREVYDRFAGRDTDPVEVIMEGPEEPVTRAVDDPIAAIADEVTGDIAAADDAVADRIASLAAADGALTDDPAPAAVDRPTQPATTPTQASVTPEAAPARPRVTFAADALSGSHLVQVGAFRSEQEALGQWGKMQSRYADYLDGKSQDIEVADLGDRGTYYRLRIGPFGTSDNAKTYCEGLKERGQDCLVRAK